MTSETQVFLRGNEYLSYLLSQSDISITSFDIDERTEMGTYNRTRPAYVMSYHKSGTAMLRVGDETFSITPGTVVLIPPNIEHDHYKTSCESTVFMWWHFTYKISGTVDVLKLFDFPLMFKPLCVERFETVFNEFVGAANAVDQFPKVVLREAKALELLYLLLESAINHPGTSFSLGAESEQFVSILAEVIRHPERKLSLSLLSKRMHLHPTYISNRFQSLFGKSLGHMQRDIRIERAKMLLSSTEMQISEIAESIGLGGNPDLDKLFKRYVGLTPTQYRNLSLNERG